MNGPLGLPQGFPQNERHGAHGRRLLPGIFHQGEAEGHMALSRGPVQAFGDRGDQSQAIGEAQMDLPQLQGFPFRFDDRPAHLEVYPRKGHGEEGAVPGLISRPRREDIVGQSGRLRHGQLGGHEEIQTFEGLLVGLCVGIGTEGMGAGDDDGPQALGVIGQDFLGHGGGRETAYDGGKIRRHGPPGPGIALVGVASQGDHLAVEDVAAPNADPAADRQERRGKVRRHGAVAVHQEPQVVTQA